MAKTVPISDQCERLSDTTHVDCITTSNSTCFHSKASLVRAITNIMYKCFLVQEALPELLVTSK